MKVLNTNKPLVIVAKTKIIPPKGYYESFKQTCFVCNQDQYLYISESANTNGKMEIIICPICGVKSKIYFST